MVTFEPIQTERLILRRLRPSDLAELMEYRNDPEIARHQGWSGIDEPTARRFIEEQRNQSVGEPGAWLQIAVERRDTAALAGDLALHIKHDDPRQAEIGYTLGRRHQGRGYATEAATALVDYIFLRLKLHRVVALIDCRNVQSAAVAERIGFRREGHCLQSFWNKGEWTDEYIYAMLDKEWREQ